MYIVHNCHQLVEKDLEPLKELKTLRICSIHGKYIRRSLFESIGPSLPLLEKTPFAEKSSLRGRLTHEMLPWLGTAFASKD